MANIDNFNEKRNLIEKEEFNEIFKEHFSEVFRAYTLGLMRYNEEIQQTIPQARVRLDSVLLHAKITESFIMHFPESYSIGKYKRVIFRWADAPVQLIIKKLSMDSRPSYIPTMLSGAIQNQDQASLFMDNTQTVEPILIFGYSRLQSGAIVDPRIVYFNGDAKWVLYLESAESFNATSSDDLLKVEVKLKKSEIRKAE